MMMQSYSRHIGFELVCNFRDLGGYLTLGGRKVAWRRLFRSAELRHLSKRDLIRLREETGLISVIDLRNATELERQGIGSLNELGFQYYNVPLITDSRDSNKEIELLRGYTNMGEVYLFYIRHKEIGRRVVEVLRIIAKPVNHPVVFHCAAGKDRTGILAAIVLSVLGVTDDDIIDDYTLSAPYMRELSNRLNSNPKIAEDTKVLPSYTWEATPESMSLFLSMLKQEYGSAREYAEIHGAEVPLFNRLESGLLT